MPNAGALCSLWFCEAARCIALFCDATRRDWLAHHFLYAAAFRFFPSNFFSTRIPLSMCFSSIRNGGRKRTTVSCVLLKSTPSASPASTIGRAGISS